MASLSSSPPAPVIIDCSWYMAGSNRSGRQEWRERRIPTSAYLDIDELCDHTVNLPHMLPKEDQFWANIGKYGVSTWRDPIVLYDSSNYYVASARVFWMLQVFGFQNVQVLMGGLEEWRKRGLPLDNERKSENDFNRRERVESSGVFRSDKVVSLEKMKELSQSIVSSHQQGAGQRHFIIDARSSERFRGVQAEPRPGLRSGHIPGSCNVPYTLLFPPEGGHFHSKEQTKAIFEKLGVSFEGKGYPEFITTTCGSGVTAAVVSLALEWCGYAGGLAVYDGSFTEWGHPQSGAPVVSSAQ